MSRQPATLRHIHSKSATELYSYIILFTTFVISRALVCLLDSASSDHAFFGRPPTSTYKNNHDGRMRNKKRPEISCRELKGEEMVKGWMMRKVYSPCSLGTDQHHTNLVKIVCFFFPLLINQLVNSRREWSECHALPTLLTNQTES